MKKGKNMGLSCKPTGKMRSILKKLQNRMEKEQKLNALAKEGKKEDK